MTDIKRFPFDFMECIEKTGNGNFLRIADSSFFTKLYFFHSASAGVNGQVEYICYTNPGNGISASAWAIKRIAYDSNGNATGENWAGGAISLNRKAADRTTYTYS